MSFCNLSSQEPLRVSLGLMVQWVEAGKAIGVEVAKLALFWVTETSRKGGESFSPCLDHRTKVLICEKDKQVVQTELAVCKGSSCLASNLFCFLSGIFVTLLFVAAWRFVSLLTLSRVPIVGKPVEVSLIDPKVVSSPLTVEDGSETDSEVASARLRARALRG